MSSNRSSGKVDFAVYDREGHLTALVEARRRLGTNADWAAQLRHNMLEHGHLPAVNLFVVVVPDRLYVWRGAASQGAAPAYELDAGPVLGPYYKRIGVEPKQVEPMAFELLVSWWLTELSIANSARVPAELLRSGVYEAVSGAEVTREAER